jgi:GntR family transcriptional repressor for pyruvate dehydrogenase complex
VAIAGAAGNRLVADMTVAIRESMRLPLLDAFRNVGAWDDLVEGLRAQHRDIYRAIEARDAKRAEDLVEEHIRSAWQRLAPSFDRRWLRSEPLTTRVRASNP